MIETMLETAPLYSSLSDDPDLAELVADFVAELPARIGALEEMAAQGNWPDLGRIGHQLKGAAGSYGFDVVTPFAAALESAAKAGVAAEEIRQAAERLASVCRRLQAGVPQ